MKQKWILIDDKTQLNKMAFVTRTIKGAGGKRLLDVTIAHPGWGLNSENVAYMTLPGDILHDPTVWKSEYRGDNNPSKDMACVVQLQNFEGKFKIIESYYLVSRNRFLRIPDGWEVIAWMEYPKPYKASRT